MYEAAGRAQAGDTLHNRDKTKAELRAERLRANLEKARERGRTERVKILDRELEIADLEERTAKLKAAKAGDVTVSPGPADLKTEGN